MKLSSRCAWVLGVCLLGIGSAAPAVGATTRDGAAVEIDCARQAVPSLPERPQGAPSGSAFVRQVLHLGGDARDRAVTTAVLSGNIPGFLRGFVPVTLHGSVEGRDRVDVTICVMPDYLAIGDDRDFVRVPMGLPAAASIADEFGLLLPTTKMVDAIHAQASVKLTPNPMPPTAQMVSTEYFWRHNDTVNRQQARLGAWPATLTAGQKKDIVLSNRLRERAGRVAIYGWHRTNGRAIQPLSTVHHAAYADYSHGLRLVAPIAFVNDTPRPLTEILQDPALATIVSSEGAIPAPDQLIRRLR